MALRMLEWLQQNKAILFLIIAEISVQIPFALSGSFLSDEATYTYASYTLGKGIVPYREIVLFHPPIGYLLLMLEVYLSGLSLFKLRLLNLLVFSVDLFIVYKVLKKIELVNGTALLAASIFSFLPTIMSYRLSSPLEFLFFTGFLYLSLYFYLGHVTYETHWLRLFIVGIFLGIATMIWLVGLLVLISILTVDVIGFIIARRRIKHQVLRVSSIIGGAVIVGLACLFVVTFVWNAFQQLMTQAVYYQSSIRSGLTLSQKLDLVSPSLYSLYLPLALGACGIAILALKARRAGFEKTITPILLFLITFLLIMMVPKNPFGQFFVFLVPLMSFFSAAAFTNLDFQNAKRISLGLLVLYLVIAGSAVPSMLTLWEGGGGHSFGGIDRYNLAEQYIGSYVKNMTSTSDMIWTSEGAIAFFADRLIVANNSTLWPYRAMYNDEFPCSYGDVFGQSNPGLRLVDSSEFIQSWDSSNVKVLVFIIGNGPVPYPDGLLWNGCSQMNGVRAWVQSNFHQVKNFVFPNVAYEYSIWVRN